MNRKTIFINKHLFFLVDLYGAPVYKRGLSYGFCRTSIFLRGYMRIQVTQFEEVADSIEIEETDTPVSM